MMEDKELVQLESRDKEGDRLPEEAFTTVEVEIEEVAIDGICGVY